MEIREIVNVNSFFKHDDNSEGELGAFDTYLSFLSLTARTCSLNVSSPMQLEE